MITLYIETHKIEEFALFEDEMPHWNKIIKSGINLCINISDCELDEKLMDELDPVGIAYKNSGTMSLPIALGNYIEAVKEDLNQTLDKPNGIFILDVEELTANDIQKKLGMAVYSCSNVPELLFSSSYYIDLPKNETIKDGWRGIIQFDKPLSNSLVITDNYFFGNEDNGENRGIKNLIPFMDAYLPDHLEIDYHLTIVSQNIGLGKEKSNEWWVKEYGKLVTAVKDLRKYNICIELVLAKSQIHKRRMLSNYVINKADKGFDVFISHQLDKVKEENDFEYLEIFSNLDNRGTKHFQSAIKLNDQLSKHSGNISVYVAANKNQLDQSLFGCNPDKTIKNRLLN